MAGTGLHVRLAGVVEALVWAGQVDPPELGEAAHCPDDGRWNLTEVGDDIAVLRWTGMGSVSQADAIFGECRRVGWVPDFYSSLLFRNETVCLMVRQGGLGD